MNLCTGAQRAEMFGLAGCAGEDNVCAIEQSFDRVTMEKLDDEILVHDRPESPDLVKHDNQTTARFGFPVDQRAD